MTEKCSTSRVIREMQIKTVLRFHFKPVRMTKIDKQGQHTSTKMEGSDSHSLLREPQTCVATIEISVAQSTSRTSYSTIAHTQRMLQPTIRTLAPQCSLILYSQ